MNPENNFRVLVTEPIPGPFREKLQEVADLTVGNRGDFITEDALRDVIADFDAVLSVLTNPLTSQVLHHASRLKIVANMAVGYNNIAIDTAKKLGITVTNTPDVLTEATAELTIGLLFATARKFAETERFLRDGKFDLWDPFGHLGIQLRGRTLGIIGMGKIGFSVAQKATALGMNICYHNRTRVSQEKESAVSARFYNHLEDLLAEADVVSVHCPLTEHTHHLLTAKHFAMMKPHSLLINTARGAVIKERDLAEALHKKIIAGAGLDVFEHEPKIDPLLLTAPNTVLLPHIGSATTEARTEMARLSYEAIIHIAKGNPPEELGNRVC